MANKFFKALLLAAVSLMIPLQMAMAQSTESVGTCMINGEQVDCAQFWDSPFAKIFLGDGIFLVLLFLAMGIFWLVMLINAIAEPNENKALWIVMIFFFGPLAALVYYIVVVKQRKKGSTMMPTAANVAGKNSTPPAGTTNFR